MSEKQISPNAPSETSNATKNIEAGLAGFILPLVLIIIIFVSLNYFSILPISESVPFLSFLPKQEKNLKQSSTSERSSEMSASKNMAGLSFGCPVKESLCAQGRAFSRDASTKNPYFALQYTNLASGTAVLAAESGEIISNKTRGEGRVKKTLMTIENKEKNIKIEYIFSGQTSGKASESGAMIREGETLGTTGGENLIILSVKNTDAGYIKIKASPDGKSILSI